MRLRSIVWLAVLAGLGCSAPPAPPPPNELPVAVAGEDVTVPLHQQVVVDGNASADPDGGTLTYHWIAAERNPALVPLAATQARFTFVPTVPGSYWFILVVNDGELDSPPDSVRITVEGVDNLPPVAVPTSVYSIYPFGATVILDAINSTDPDGDALSYAWRLLDGPEPQDVTIADSTARQTRATLPTAGEYHLALRVSDGSLTDSTEFVIRIEPPDNLPPEPVIAAVAEAAVQTLVLLDGSGSTDADGDTLTLHWSVLDPAGLPVLLSDSTSAQISFTPTRTGSHVVLLEADDGRAAPVRARAEVRVLEAIYNQADGMIEIPAGAFTMGSDQGAPDEAPPHRVQMSAFWMDKYEVAAGQYQECVDAGYCTAAGGSANCNGGHPERADHPINCVTWEQARDYCVWADKRLPTEAEWEMAARGTDQRRFVWGDAYPDRTLLNYNNDVGATTPVGSYPLGISFYGLHDMGGNVQEWTADYYAADYYTSGAVLGPAGPATGTDRVARGASWSIGVPTEVLTATARHRFVATTSAPSVGFRCARTAPPGE